MKTSKMILAAVLLMGAMTAMAQVKTGIEVLREHNFDVLQGKRVGLCTKQHAIQVVVALL